MTEENLTEDEMGERIRKEWRVEEVKELEAKGDSTITTSREWYHPDGNFNLEKFVAKWHRPKDNAKIVHKVRNKLR